MTFEDMGLPARLCSNLAEMGFDTPTPIQEKAIPLALEGRDVMGLAQTGTGKTASFGLPMLALLGRMEGKPQPKTVRGLVLAPTRELAKQIHDNLRAYSEGTSVRIGLVVGGASINAQAKRLERGLGILVATPGRLIDLMDRDAVRLDKTQFLVLDEADQMLDMGFIHALRQIAPKLAADRHTMLFSATMPKHMNELAQTYLNDPVRVETAPPGKPADKVTQELHYVTKTSKMGLLIELLDKHRNEAAIVFARTKHGAERMKRTLVAKGYGAEAVHGNKSQGQRERAIKAFRAGEVMVLVATDVAARGLDIPEVRYVYNYDLPNVPDNYVHRIGRTARAGRDGAAIAFCAPDEMGELKAIQKLLKKDIPVASGRAWEGAEIEKPQPRGGRGGGNRNGGGGRPGNKPRGGGGGGKPRRNNRRGKAA